MSRSDALAAALEAAVPGAVTRDESVAALTTYRLGGPIAVVARVGDEAALGRVAEVVAAHRPTVLVLGRGSNVLVADEGFSGLGLLLSGEFEAVVFDDDRGTVRAGSAVPLPALARQATARARGGLEFYVGIPGSVGGAVRMNAGGHGRETREVLVRAWYRHLPDGDVAPTVAAVDALQLGYRSSVLGAADVVTRAEFSTVADDLAACRARLEEIVRWRREHQPGGSNAGSVFRNPPGDSAGRLIDVAGLKGARVGGAVVSTKHANFIAAEAGATADDVRRLIRLVQERVEDATGVRLVPELHLVGFGDDPR